MGIILEELNFQVDTTKVVRQLTIFVNTHQGRSDFKTKQNFSQNPEGGAPHFLPTFSTFFLLFGVNWKSLLNKVGYKSAQLSFVDIKSAYFF